VSNLINYPNLKKPRKTDKEINFANRGMSLENDLNLTNEYYRSIGKAIIHKKPLPLQIVAVDYRKRSAARITEAYFKTPSTTDYNGVYRGFYLDYDAKETNSLTAFPLSQVHQHQLKHLQAVIQQKGIAFLIIRFTKCNQDYLLLAKDLLAFIAKNARKSLAKSWIEENAYLIKQALNPRLSYLEIIDQIIEEVKYV